MSGVLHVTATLRGALRRPLSAAAAAPDNALGAWSATLLNTRPRRLLLAVCHASRLAMVWPAAPLVSAPERFGPALFELLLMLGAPVDAARREVDAMQPLQLVPTVDRGVRALMGSCRETVTWRLADGATLAEVNAFLAMNRVLRPAGFVVGERSFELLGLNPAPVRRLRDPMFGLAT